MRACCLSYKCKCKVFFLGSDSSINARTRSEEKRTLAVRSKEERVRRRGRPNAARRYEQSLLLPKL